VSSARVGDSEDSFNSSEHWRNATLSSDITFAKTAALLEARSWQNISLSDYSSGMGGGPEGHAEGHAGHDDDHGTEACEQSFAACISDPQCNTLRQSENFMAPDYEELCMINQWCQAVLLYCEPGFEAQSILMQDSVGSLDWLLVVGQDIRCHPRTQIWDSTAGNCKLCPAGYTPKTSSTSEIGTECIQCHPTHAGTAGSCVLCQDGTMPNTGRSACVPCSAYAAGVGGKCSSCRSPITGLEPTENHTACRCPAGTYDSMNPPWPVRARGIYDVSNTTSAGQNFDIANIHCWSTDKLSSTIDEEHTVHYDQDSEGLNFDSHDDLRSQQHWTSGPRRRCIKCPACVDCEIRGTVSISAGFSIPGPLHSRHEEWLVPSAHPAVEPFHGSHAASSHEDDLDVYLCPLAAHCQNKSGGCGADSLLNVLEGNQCVDQHAGERMRPPSVVHWVKTSN
jgi:hypothetical protein